MTETPSVSVTRAGFGFGTPGGPDPRAAQRAAAESRKNGHSIRGEMRQLVKEGFKIEELTPDGLTKLVADAARKGDLRRALAIRGLHHALFGQTDSFDRILDNVEGKLANTNINAGLDLDSEEAKRDADDVRKRLLKGLQPDIIALDESPSVTGEFVPSATDGGEGTETS
jgi:hypothetical protein